MMLLISVDGVPHVTFLNHYATHEACEQASRQVNQDMALAYPDEIWERTYRIYCV